MAGNTTTKKQFNKIGAELPKHRATPPRTVNAVNRPGDYDGQVAESEPYAGPMNMGPPAKLTGLEGLHDDIGEKSGFITDGYLDKGHTPYGEAAKFNYLPPGMDIDNQVMCEINEMPLRKLVEESYPGDGWMPKPRDVKE